VFGFGAFCRISLAFVDLSLFFPAFFFDAALSVFACLAVSFLSSYSFLPPSFCLARCSRPLIFLACTLSVLLLVVARFPQLCSFFLSVSLAVSVVLVVGLVLPVTLAPFPPLLQ
jgi:hypothetical protein